MPQLDWAGELASTRIDYNGEEVKTAQLVTWRQLEPALPPPGNAGCVRAADLLEGWARACMEDPTKTLLPEDRWPYELPQPRVWVESQKDWHEICAGAAERGIFTFLKEQGVFHIQGRPLLNGLFGVEKKNKSLDSGEPVLLMLINAIPANSLQQTIEANIRTLPYFGQWSAISVDEEDKVSGSLERAGHDIGFLCVPPRASVVQISGSGQTRFGPICFKMGAQTVGRRKRVSCGGSHGHGGGLLQQIHRKLRFLPKPMGSREVRRDGPVPRSGRPQDTSFYSVYLDGFSHAELKHWDQLSHLVQWSWEAKAVHEAWDRWGVPSQTVKAIVNELELETLGCRIDGNAGVIAPPRSVVSRMIGLTAWFARNTNQRRPKAEILGGRWVRCFQFREEVSSLFTIGIGSIHKEASHAEGL